MTALVKTLHRCANRATGAEDGEAKMTSDKGPARPDRRQVAAGVAVTAAAMLAGPLTAAGQAREAVVETSVGRVRGAPSPGAVAFLGVPYGASTAGPGRFLPPRPPRPWTGVRDPWTTRIIAPQTNPKVPPPPPSPWPAVRPHRG